MRLAEETHDVLAIIEFEEGLLCDVQFSFSSVQLMKVFAHAAYNISRVDGFFGMLMLAYNIPIFTSNFKAGYSTRSRDAITLKLAL